MKRLCWQAHHVSTLMSAYLVNNPLRIVCNMHKDRAKDSPCSWHRCRFEEVEGERSVTDTDEGTTVGRLRPFRFTSLGPRSLWLGLFVVPPSIPPHSLPAP
jgi:hypothetical protein